VRLVIEYLAALARGRDLTEEQAAAAMDLVMNDDATPSQIAGLLMGLRVKGETIDELTGMARTIRAHAVPVKTGYDVLDVVGTGGDGLGTFNISTLSAIVAAACGVRVAKHGNRAASSRCGAADVLEALGVAVDLGPDGVARCVAEVGIGFMFAPAYHPSFRYAAVARRELSVRTVFNLLGPLCNPARAPFQAMGVADEALVAPIADVLVRMGARRVLVFHGGDGMDELSTAGPSTVMETLDGERRSYALDPAGLGLRPAGGDDVRGGDAAENAAIARAILGGEDGPRRDVVLLNAAAGLRAAGAAASWEDGVAAAAGAIDSGRAARLLERWADVSRSLVPA
jgi:anthranilate phosphoribosyltransferase